MFCLNSVWLKPHVIVHGRQDEFAQGVIIYAVFLACYYNGRDATHGYASYVTTLGMRCCNKSHNYRNMAPIITSVSFVCEIVIHVS